MRSPKDDLPAELHDGCERRYGLGVMGVDDHRISDIKQKVHISNVRSIYRMIVL